MVLKDEMVIDLGRTIAGTPPTIKGLIAQWSQPTADRFASVASDAMANPPASAMKVAQLKLLPPITDPKVLLSTAVNYQEHAMEMRSTTHDLRERRGRGPEGRAAASPATGTGGPATRGRTPTSSSRPTPPSPAHNDPIILPTRTRPRSTGNAR